MKCEKCQKNDASVFITQDINGEHKEMNLCESCAIEYEQPVIDQALSFQQFLTGFIESNKTGAQSVTDSCPTCHMTLKEFKRNSKVGCGQCYKAFDGHLMPIIKRLHGTTHHTGKVPGKINEEVKSQKNLAHFEGQLKVALMKEDYEKAAYYRDMIRSLKRGDQL